MDAVEHFLYGIAIDEGYGGNRANILALDVLYPEVCKLCELKIVSHHAGVYYMYEVDDLFDFKRARDETGRSNKVLHVMP